MSSFTLDLNEYVLRKQTVLMISVGCFTFPKPSYSEDLPSDGENSF